MGVDVLLLDDRVGNELQHGHLHHHAQHGQGHTICRHTLECKVKSETRELLRLHT